MEPERRVRELVNHYGALEVLHPIISELLESPHYDEIFQKSLQQELKLIRSRSNRLEHHEISITQKAFMLLMDNSAHDVGAAELYVEEIIGLKLVAAKEKRETLQTAVTAKNIMLSTSAPDEQLTSRSSEKNHRQMSEELFLSPGIVIEDPKAQHRPALVSKAEKDNVKPDSPEHVTLPATAFNSDSDPKFNRLWRLFMKARDEFNAIDIDSQERTTRAKFLRDTTENVMDYIKLMQPSAMATNDASSKETQGLTQKLSELRFTLNRAVEVANTGCGGKKRRFEYHQNASQPGVTSTPVHSRRQRSPPPYHRRPRRFVYHERPPRPAGPQGRPRGFDDSLEMPRFTDKYRPAYN